MSEDHSSTATAEPKGAAAFAAARETIGKASTEQPPAPPEEETPPPAPPAEEPEPPADQPPEPGTEPETLLTDEQLAALPAKERAAAIKWQKTLTERNQKIAAREKELQALDEWRPLIDALTNDPDAALAEIARARGMTVSKAQQEVVESKTAETLAELPQELQFLKPVFDAYGKKLLETVRGELAPIQEATTAMISEAAAAETQSTIDAFTAKHPDWGKHEAKMIELGKKFIPTAGAMTDYEYMETLYKLVTADISKAEQTKAVVERMTKSAAAVEPNGSGVAVPEKRIEHAPPPNFGSMNNAEKIRHSWEAAKRGDRWGK